MQAFEYASPTTKEQAVALLAGAWGSTEVLAGGTDLLSLMKDGGASPKRLINIKGIKELEGIRYAPASGLRIGALVTFQQLVEDANLRRLYPALSQAAEGVTSPQIRNAGTAGGDLCQRPRCWYFRTGMGLLAQDEEGNSLVVNGRNEYHAVLGNSGPAYFVNPSSLAPALIALSAKVRLFGPRGSRDLAVEQFFRSPKSGSERENAREPNEIVTEIVVPPAAGVRSATYEVRHRHALDWPLAAASVALKLTGNKVSGARIVLGHVAPVPWPAPEADKYLAGKPITDKTAGEAGEAAVAGAAALSHNAYKIQLAKVAVKRAILRAATGRA